VEPADDLTAPERLIQLPDAFCQHRPHSHARSMRPRRRSVSRPSATRAQSVPPSL
jgi:hypothetical protein